MPFLYFSSILFYFSFILSINSLNTPLDSRSAPRSSGFKVPKGISPFIRMLIGLAWWETGRVSSILGSASRSKIYGWLAWITCPFLWQGWWNQIIYTHIRGGKRCFQKKKIYPGRQKRNSCPVYLLYLLCSTSSFSFLSINFLHVPWNIFQICTICNLFSFLKGCN